MPPFSDRPKDPYTYDRYAMSDEFSPPGHHRSAKTHDRHYGDDTDDDYWGKPYSASSARPHRSVRASIAPPSASMQDAATATQSTESTTQPEETTDASVKPDDPVIPAQAAVSIEEEKPPQEQPKDDEDGMEVDWDNLSVGSEAVEGCSCDKCAEIRKPHTSRIIRMHMRKGTENAGKIEDDDQDCPVIYSTNVLRQSVGKRGRDKPKVVMTYHHNTPFDLTIRDAQTEEALAQRSSTAQREGAKSGTGSTWIGPVLEIQNSAILTKLPRRLSPPDEDEDGLVKIRNSVLFPRNIQDLVLEERSKSRMVIRSPLLVKALAVLVGYYPSFQRAIDWGYDTKGLSSPTLSAILEPYAPLMQNLAAFEEFIKNPAAVALKHAEEGVEVTDEVSLATQKEHMQHLCSVLRPLHKDWTETYYEHINEKIPKVSFDMLWYLFKPGMDVYLTSASGIVYMAVISKVTSELDDMNKETVKEKDKPTVWNIEFWDLETNGVRVARRKFTRSIPAYQGLKLVTDLPVVPAAMWDKMDGGARRRDFLKRNKIVERCIRQGFLLAHYNGPDIGGNRYYIGKVVVDHRRGAANANEDITLDLGDSLDSSMHYKGYDDIYLNTESNLQMEAGFSTDSSLRPSRLDPPSFEDTYKYDYDNDLRSSRQKTTDFPSFDNKQEDQKITEKLTDHQVLLLHPRTYAYALKIKQWISVKVDHIEEIVSSTGSIDNLVIGDDELKTIRALSNRQNTKNESWAADFIEGKGSGKIILLHGPPGVGKTYTVESIAEWLHRPLLALTVADIGTVETRIEGELVKWFALAEAWNAVLLVDEADIFLERRQNRDLARNGLVSAFLRRMEYFKGLLFLTTNRVGQIDDAFISRIHVAIPYRSLNHDNRQKIWNGFFKKLAKDRSGKIQISPTAKKWVLADKDNIQGRLNGRDIRNALQTAITLAEFEHEEDATSKEEGSVVIIDKEHFERVLGMSKKFHDYVNSIRDQDETKRARARQDRNDGGDITPEADDDDDSAV